MICDGCRKDILDDHALDAFLVIRKHTLQTFKELFDENELIAMADIYNGLKMRPKEQAMKMMVIANIEDGEKYDGALSRWNVDLDILKSKIRDLHPAELFHLMNEISNFWYSDEDQKDVRRWAQKFNE